MKRSKNMKSKIVCLGLILVFLYPKVIAQGQTQLPQSAEENVERVVEVWVWITKDPSLLLAEDEKQKLKRWTPVIRGPDQSLLLYDSGGISRISGNVLRVWVWKLDKKNIEALSKEMDAFISSKPSPEELERTRQELEFIRQQIAEGKSAESLALRSARLIKDPDGTHRRMTEKEYVANFGTEGLEEYKKILRTQEEIRKLIREKELFLYEIDCKERTMAVVQSVTYDREGKVVDSIYFREEKDRPQTVIIPNSAGEHLYSAVCKRQERGAEKTK